MGLTVRLIHAYVLSAVVCRIWDQGSVRRVRDQGSVDRVRNQGSVDRVWDQGTIWATLVGNKGSLYWVREHPLFGTIWVTLFGKFRDKGSVGVVGGVRIEGSVGVPTRQDLRISRRIEAGRGGVAEQAPASVGRKALRHRQHQGQQDGHPQRAHTVSSTTQSANTVVSGYSDTLGDCQKCHCNQL